MKNYFIVEHKLNLKKEDLNVVMTLRVKNQIQEKFNELSAKSHRSRNELMCMALQFALDHLEFQDYHSAL